MSIFFAILLTVAAFAFLAYPLLRGPRRAATADAGDEHVDGLLTRRDTTYSMLKELEFDYHSGLLTEEDYRDLEGRYRGKAISILKSLDQAEPAGDDAGEEIERQVAELRREKQRFCSQCGVAVRPADRFCANCGASLQRETDN
ncbi:MAG: zinc-ribbon domain-containing protein [Dehalococcoidales bacterium]